MDGSGALKTDLLIVGGGLAGCLIALALRARRPEVRLTLIEAGDTLGGNHIWSFFDSDVTAADRSLVASLAAWHWPGNQIAFPGLTRRLDTAYHSIPSERLDRAVRAVLPEDQVLTLARVAALDPGGATLTDGRRIGAAGVIDARGFAADAPLDLGWQKFVGRLLRLDRPHGLILPTIMDATVRQEDGYRFVYLLPFDDDRLFVEDTYYSDERVLDVARVVSRIDAYVAARGWTIAAVERQEAASLPIAMGGNFESLWRGDGAKVARVGMAAGLFHPTTGYSLPDAVRTAVFIAGLDDLGSSNLERVMHDYAGARWRERGFYRLLARMLFRAAHPDERWRVLARFYRQDERLIGRFYAGNSTLFDKARILMGKPPVPIGRALGVLKA